MKETIIETEVTYTLKFGGEFYIIKHVPVRVCRETGERFFSPETVERIQALIKGGKKPARLIKTPVYEYAWTMSKKHMDWEGERSLFLAGHTPSWPNLPSVIVNFPIYIEMKSSGEIINLKSIPQ